MYSFWDGRYNGFGIGQATDCIFDFTDIYIGDKIDSGINPLVQFNFDLDLTANINCSEHMSPQMTKETLLY